MTKMVKYCKQDVILLEKVFKRIQPFIKHNTHFGMLRGGEKYHCPKCGSPEVGIASTRYTATGIKKHQMKCRSCFGYHTISNKCLMDKYQDELSEKYAS